MNLLDVAIRLAVEAHSGQVDKQGDPYILHPLRVMLKMKTGAEMIVAVLHDVVEDTELTMKDVTSIKEMSTNIVNAIEAITRRGEDDVEPETYKEYIKRVTNSPLAVRVKLADLEDNMGNRYLRTPSEHKGLALRYHEAWQFLTTVPDCKMQAHEFCRALVNDSIHYVCRHCKWDSTTLEVMPDDVWKRARGKLLPQGEKG